jgi:6-pyruvoyltetrahydropterin/6-carboxytetrahydropterin synthase
MYSITFKHEFDAAHRLFLYVGPCANIHGHRYVAEVTVEGEQLNSLGMLVDFGWMKKIVGDWIDTSWDHRLVLSSEDSLLENIPVDGSGLAQLPGNPTAENMAKYLFDMVCGFVPSNIKVVKVRIYETPNCWAEYQA